jgi:hypothetical protein
MFLRPSLSLSAPAMVTQMKPIYWRIGFIVALAGLP